MLLRSSARSPRFTAWPRSTVGPQVGTGALSVGGLIAGSGVALTLPNNRVVVHRVPASSRYARFTYAAMGVGEIPASRFGTGALTAVSAIAGTSGRVFFDVGADVLYAGVTVTNSAISNTYGGTGTLDHFDSMSGVGGRRLLAATSPLSVSVTLAGVGGIYLPGPQAGTGALQTAHAISGIGLRSLVGSGALIAEGSVTGSGIQPKNADGVLSVGATISGAGVTTARWRTVTPIDSNWTRITPLN